MLFLSNQQRKEARSRAPDYAAYYLREHGADAERRLLKRIAQQRRFSYYRLLYRLTLREVRKQLRQTASIRAAETRIG